MKDIGTGTCSRFCSKDYTIWYTTNSKIILTNVSHEFALHFSIEISRLVLIWRPLIIYIRKSRGPQVIGYCNLKNPDKSQPILRDDLYFFVSITCAMLCQKAYIRKFIFVIIIFTFLVANLFNYIRIHVSNKNKHIRVY